MEKKITLKKLLILLLAMAGVFMVGCSKDSPVTLDEEGNPIDRTPEQVGIVSGNPELNQFLITSNGESVVTLDAKTGQETVIYTFDDLTDIEILADYDNGRIFVTTDDNAVNALDVNAKSLVWDTPMLSYKFSSLGLTEPVCLDGVCYASGGSGVVVALDENTGEVKWSYSTDPDGELDNVLNENETPIVHGDKVYIFYRYAGFAEVDPKLFVLNRETGALLNSYRLDYELTGTPLIEGNTMYVPAKNMYAIDLDTFDVKWQFDTEGVGSPAISEGRLVVSGIPVDNTIYSRLYCLDLTSGTMIWEKDTGFDTIWDPLIIGNVIFGNYEEASSFAFSNNGRPFAIKLSDGEQLWFRDDVSVDNSPVYANGHLFFLGHDINGPGDTDENTGMLCMDANTGAVLWINPDYARFKSIPPLVVGENGVFGPGYYRGS